MADTETKPMAGKKSVRVSGRTHHLSWCE